MEDTFLSEWGAVENARFLSLEVALDNIGTFPASSTRRCHILAPLRRSRPRQHMGFADTVSVCIGPHDALNLFEVQIPQSIVCTGQMPWHMQFTMDNSLCDPLSLSEAVLIQEQYNPHAQFCP